MPHYTQAQLALVDGYIRAFVRSLSSRPWRRADVALAPRACNRAVWRRGTFEPCNAPMVWQDDLRARCEEHRP